MKLFLLIVLIANISSTLCDGTLETVCKTDADCLPYQDKMVVSSCAESLCKCSNKNTGKIENCIPRKQSVNNRIGSACRTHQCNIPHSICDMIAMKCLCEKDFISSPDDLRCLPASVHLTQPCEMNEQCVKFDRNAVCSANKTCECLNNFTPSGDNCHSLVNIGQNCQSSEQCLKLTQNATCLDHKCACDKGFVSSDNGEHCLPIRYYLEDCEQISQCENGIGVGSICDNGKCICDEIHINVTIDDERMICQRNVLFGDSCKEHTDCVFYKGETSMECFQYRCRCRFGYELFDADSKRCVKMNSASLPASVANIVMLVALIVSTRIIIL